MAGTRKTTGGEPHSVKKKKTRDGKSPISEKLQKELFAKYVEPNLTSIKVLTVKYTDRYQNVEDNYVHVLQQMFQYIHTYDEKRSLETWIHIVTKRACFNQNMKRAERLSGVTEIDRCSSDTLHQHGTANMEDAGFGTLVDNISDTVYQALLSLDPFKLSAFLLYAQGISVREIAKIEYRNGHLERKSEELIKSRIYWAREELVYILEKNGIKAKSHKGKKYD